MSVVNFTITKPLETKISRLIKEQGFTSKAEFFRFVTLTYLNNQERSLKTQNEDERYATSVRALKQAIRQKLQGKNLPSLKEQMSTLRV